MNVSRPIHRRWVVDHVDDQAKYLARRLAAKYDVRIGQVVAEALYELEEYLSEGGDIPDGWRTV